MVRLLSIKLRFTGACKNFDCIVEGALFLWASKINFQHVAR